MAETGASLEWLANSEGEFLTNEQQPKEMILSDEKLERLANLKEKGVITDEEFNILKINLIKIKE
jgi:hypothetical protein